ATQRRDRIAWDEKNENYQVHVLEGTNNLLDKDLAILLQLDLFSRQCLRRGREVAVEGALLVMSQLQDSAWDATEGIDYDDVELAENPFDVIRQTLDLLYQHEDEVELPERCQEFFEQFKREKGEELQAYIVRQQTMLRKLKELQVEVPPLLAGWHMLSRAGVPRWTHPQIKALCGGELNVKGVAKAMARMFGGDSKPNLKDSALRGADINMAETYKHYYEYDDVDEAYYQSYDEDEIYMDDYEEARKVVEEKEKEKEKGGKNNNATKGKGKSFVPPGAKRFAFVRFKRYRLPASGIKEVPDEANMVTELDVTDLETVCGTSVWNHLVEYMVMRDIMDNVVTKHEPKDFRTANGHYVTMLDTEDADDTTYVGSMITDDVFEMDFGIEVHMTDMVDDVVQLVCSRSEHQQRKMRFWEVYVDEGNLSQFLNKKDDVEARIFSLPDWNFENREEQLRFLDLMDQERPLHIMMAFECRLWSPMQNMNYRTDERKKILAEMRAVEEKTHLRFYSEVHKKGKSIGCDVTAEQPAEALSWRTTTLESMRGYFETVLDRCRTALKMNPRDTKLVKKPTRFRSTKRLVTEACNLSCISRGPHQQMMGQGKALKQMRNYEPGLVKILGDAIYNSKEVAWRKRCQKLIVAVKQRDFPKEYVQVTRSYKCPTSWSKQEPKAVRVATLCKAPHFNHTIAIGTFCVEWDGQKLGVLTVLDEYSRYEMDHRIIEETADMEIALLESSWMRSFGFPTHLRLDASGPHQSSTFADWASLHGMRLELVPRGAHHSPVCALDVAEMGQDPFYYPGGYALSDAAGKSLDSFDDDKPLADKAAIDSTATNQNDIDMEPPEKEETFPIHAPTTIASTRSSPRPRTEMPSPEKIDSRAAGVWTDTGPERPDAPAVTATSNPPAGDENDHAGKEGPQQAEHPTGIVERREQQPEVLPESFNRERRMYAAAPREHEVMQMTKPAFGDVKAMQFTVKGIVIPYIQDGFGSDDGLGRPVTHEGDIITPEHTPRLVNGTRMLADDGGMATWLTPGQIAYMQGEGYYVLSDKEVNRRRAELQASMPPSINEVLTPQVMNEIVEGNHTGTVQVPIDPSNWDGVEPQERDERTQLLEDCLLLAIQPEEMNNERLLESKALRAQLRTVRRCSGVTASHGGKERELPGPQAVWDNYHGCEEIFELLGILPRELTGNRSCLGMCALWWRAVTRANSDKLRAGASSAVAFEEAARVQRDNKAAAFVLERTRKFWQLLKSLRMERSMDIHGIDAIVIQ
ncbi:unnamed protein product, partial [Cladocopium goreaui]